MPVGPYSQDVVTHIVNVEWGAQDVIVVFVDTSSSDDLPATHTLLDDSVTLLKTWKTPYQAAGFQPGFTSRAYQVSSGAGEFLKSRSQPTPGEGLGFWIDALVFALDQDDPEGSLARAETGTKLAMPAVYLISHSDSDLPFNIAPPGLLWFVETGPMNGNTSMTWKIRFDNHRLVDPRGDPPGTPPNAMTQVYPLGTYSGPIGVDTVTWLGYLIYAYRLDEDGTDTVYGKINVIDGSQNIDIAWNRPIEPTHFDARGIPAQDPPPLITSDLK